MFPIPNQTTYVLLFLLVSTTVFMFLLWLFDVGDRPCPYDDDYDINTGDVSVSYIFIKAGLALGLALLASFYLFEPAW